MGGSESKATVLECMIKNLKKVFGADYGVKMMPNRLHTLCEVEWPPMGVGWPPENTMNLKIVESSLYSSHRRARTPRSVSIYCLMARVSSRPSYLDKVLYPEGKGKNINGTKND